MHKILLAWMLLSTSGLALSQVAIPPLTDVDGHSIYRVKYAPTGWSFQLKAMEFQTCTLSSIYNVDQDNANVGDATVKLYDADNVELTTQLSADTSCVKTVVDWEPAYDYEVVGGLVATTAAPTQDLRVWLVGVPDFTPAQGGTKVFINGFNLAFLEPKTVLQIDGRNSKALTYSATYHTNKLRTIVRSVAGAKNKILQSFEIYKQ